MSLLLYASFLVRQFAELSFKTTVCYRIYESLCGVMIWLSHQKQMRHTNAELSAKKTQKLGCHNVSVSTSNGKLQIMHGEQIYEKLIIQNYKNSREPLGFII